LFTCTLKLIKTNSRERLISDARSTAHFFFYGSSVVQKLAGKHVSGENKSAIFLIPIKNINLMCIQKHFCNAMICVLGYYIEKSLFLSNKIPIAIL
jgi:hypothetical protein